MGTTAESAAGQSKASRMGFRAGQVVQEFGYDEDIDLELRTEIEDLTGEELMDEDAHDVVDVVLLWWRDGDGDLVDALVDVPTNLAEGGVVWLLTPKPGREGHIEASDIEEAAPTAGLHAMSTVSACQDWTGTKLGTPRGQRR